MSLERKFTQGEAQSAWTVARLTWLVVAVMGMSLAIGMLALRFTIDTFDFSCVLGVAALYAGFGWLHVVRKAAPDPKMTFMLTAIGQLVFIVAFMGPLTYVTGALNMPLHDKLFLAIDRAVGLDPKMILDSVNARPELARWLEVGYGLIRAPLLAIPIVLGMTARFQRLQVFVLAFAIALILTLVISALLPAIGTYYGLGVDASTMTNLDSAIYAKQLRDIPALRDGSLRDLELFKLAGIVAFPSFHAASAVLFAWALWPIRGFGPIALALNVVMLVATPVVGAHYSIDVVGGIAVGYVAIVLAKRIADARQRAVSHRRQTTPVVAAT